MNRLEIANGICECFGEWASRHGRWAHIQTFAAAKVYLNAVGFVITDQKGKKFYVVVSDELPDPS